jgi:iron(III) transport system permease protein
LLALAPVLAGLAGGLRAGGGWSPAPLRQLAAGGRMWALLGGSLVVSVTGCVVALVLGLAGAVAAVKVRTGLRGPILLVSVVGAMVPLFLTATGWRRVLPWLWVPGSHGAAGLVLGLSLAPWGVLLVSAALAGVPGDLEEAAAMEAGAGVALRRVTLPLSAWGVGAAAIVLWVLGMTETSVPDLMGARTFAEEVYSQYALGRPGAAAASALPVAGLCLVAAAGLGAMRGRLASSLNDLQAGRGCALRLRGGARWVVTALGAGVAAVLVVPVWGLVAGTGSVGTLVRTVGGAWGEIERSAGLGLASAAGCVLVSLPLGYFALEYRLARAAWLVCAAVLLTSPAPLAGIGLIRLLDAPGPLGRIYDSSAVTLLAMFARSLGPALLIAGLALRASPRSCEEMGRMDGAGLWRRLWHIHLPLCGPAAAAALLVSFAWSVTEAGSSVLVSPPGEMVLSVRILTLAHYGSYANVSALGLAMIGLVACPAAVVFAFRARLLGGGRLRGVRE